MIQKKLCLLGSFSVGKTSLVRRYVSSIFDEKYLTTVGVKIDKKILPHPSGGDDLMLMIWDLAGEDDFTDIKTSYLRGAAACVVVVDGTREKSAEAALRICELARQQLPGVELTVALNKADLQDIWEIDEQTLREKLEGIAEVVKTSAKTGNSVVALFEGLALRLLPGAAASDSSIDRNSGKAA